MPERQSCACLRGQYTLRKIITRHSNHVPRLNLHSPAAPPVPHFPRFRALALFGRRPPQRVDSLVMPASENLHNSTITDVTSPLITHGPCAGVGQRARRELAVELVVNHPCDASPVDATSAVPPGAGRQEAERADQQHGKPAGPTLSTTQLVENHRLDVERALVGEACAEAGLINQPAEQVEIGVRRYHDVETAIGLQPLASMLGWA